MDRPEDVVCFRCGAIAGLARPGEFAWTCPQCHQTLELDETGATIALTDHTHALVRKLAQTDSDYHRDVQKYMVLVGGSRSTKGTYFPPDDTGFQPIAIALMLGAIGIFLLYIRQFTLGGVVVLLAYGCYRLLEADRARKSAAFKKATEEWKLKRDQIQRQIAGG